MRASAHMLTLSQRFGGGPPRAARGRGPARRPPRADDGTGGASRRSLEGPGLGVHGLGAAVSPEGQLVVTAS